MSITLPRELLAQHVSDVFVETGTWDGACARMALSVGFPRVLTIDADPACASSLSGVPGIAAWHGPSEELLWPMIEGETGRMTFWLDAHHMPGHPAPPQGMRCPLPMELVQIARHPRTDHTILVDDVDALDWFGLQMGQILALLREINPAYEIRHADSLRGSDCILVASLGS